MIRLNHGFYGLLDFTDVGRIVFSGLWGACSWFLNQDLQDFEDYCRGELHSPSPWYRCIVRKVFSGRTVMIRFESRILRIIGFHGCWTHRFFWALGCLQLVIESEFTGFRGLL